MDLELDDDQRAVQEAVAALLEQHIDLDRTTTLAAEGRVDTVLREELSEAGFLALALDDETTWLDAALLVEAVAHRGGLIDVGAAALVAPAVCGRSLPGPVALIGRDHRGPVRFGPQARSALVEHEAGVRLVALEGTGEPLETNFGWPVGPVSGDLTRGEELGAEAIPRLHRFWRLALAAECVGAMRAALETTVAYVKERRQFGRSIGSFQAIQHRLAELSVLIDGGRWLVYEAAYQDADAERVAVAAAQVTHTAERVFAETHQLTGAMGYTREHVLHLWTMRLPVLRLELGGAREHRLAAARARWIDGRG